MASSRIIEVPIDNSNDVLEIDCSQLPEHSSEICTILETEGSALRFYYVFALEYYKQEKTEEAIAALKRGLANARANDLTPKVPLLNLLASINVQKAKLATTSGTAEERDMQLKMATALLTESEKISRQEPRTFLVKGLLAMAKRSPDMALQQFNIALKLNPTCVASLLGKARVLFSKRQFQTALGIYQRVLTLHPHGKPDARIGIGLCLLRLGHTKDARRALERAMVANPQSAAPHVLLATMEMNEAKRLMDSKLNPKIDGGEVGEALEEGGKLLNAAMGRLQMAYELQPENAAVLTRLADRLFYSGDYEGTRRLGERALRTGDTPAIRAEAQYQIARAHHAARRFDLAFDAYQKCLASNDKHALARFGLGQMQLQRTDMSSAEAT
ncbi:protein required for normal CLN1 and CLN2 G1 cyclin expression, partial [Linderina macrospora]